MGAKKVRAESTAKAVEAERRERYWDLQEASEAYLNESPFPELLSELDRFMNPADPDFGGIGISLVKEKDSVQSTGHWHYSYKTRARWINVIALPDGTIKVEGNFFGRTILRLDDWRALHPPASGRRIAEVAIAKAWKHPHRRTYIGTGAVDL
jgi:hypothetical protein